MRDHLADLDDITRFRAIAIDAQNAAVDRLDVLRGLVAFQDEQRLARLDDFAVALEPFDEGALLHRPATPRDRNLWHENLPFSLLQQIENGLFDLLDLRRHGF